MPKRVVDYKQYVLKKRVVIFHIITVRPTILCSTLRASPGLVCTGGLKFPQSMQIDRQCICMQISLVALYLRVVAL